MLINQLIDAGADINAPVAERAGKSPLAAAIQNNDLKMIDELLKLGAEPTESALVAAVSRSTDLLQRLLTTRLARVQRLPRVCGIRALQHAIIASNIPMIEILLRNGVDPNVVMKHQYLEAECLIPKDVLWESPFGTALKLKTGKSLKVVKTLLDVGARSNDIVCNDLYIHYPRTALLVAIDQKDLKLVELLLEAGADVNDTSHNITRSPLQLAVERGSIDIVRVLLEKSADINTPAHCRYGATALQLAAMKGYLGIATLLLTRGADVNAPPALVGSRTALEAACEQGRIDIAQLLLSAGAQVVGAGSGQYENARRYATEHGHIALRRLLDAAHSQQLKGL